MSTCLFYILRQRFMKWGVWQETECVSWANTYTNRHTIQMKRGREGVPLISTRVPPNELPCFGSVCWSARHASIVPITKPLWNVIGISDLCNNNKHAQTQCFKCLWTQFIMHQLYCLCFFHLWFCSNVSTHPPHLDLVSKAIENHNKDIVIYSTGRKSCLIPMGEGC